MTPLDNWAGNLSYHASRVFVPQTLDELRNVVATGNRVKSVGSRHSFNDIADTTGDLISLEYFDRVLEIDVAQRAVTVEAGIRYGDLSRDLHNAGLALHNLASLPHISVAGACATATHGSGVLNGNLATAVSALEMVTADGDLVTLSRKHDGDRFNGVVVALGALGVVTKLTLDVVPAFDVMQVVYLGLPFTTLESAFDDIMTSGYSVSLFLDWQSDLVDQVWVKQTAADLSPAEFPEFWLGASRATRNLHPIMRLPADNCTPQLGIAGPSYERLPHFRMEFTPSSGEELQSEYLIPRSSAWSALREMAILREQIASCIQISEVRVISADELWMSPCYQQDCIAIHFTWHKDKESVYQLLPQIEQRLAQFDARPHWGKLFTMEPQILESRFERLTDFRNLREYYDPTGKFLNSFLERYIVRGN